jgi:hypothetical protein
MTHVVYLVNSLCLWGHRHGRFPICVPTNCLTMGLNHKLQTNPKDPSPKVALHPTQGVALWNRRRRQSLTVALTGRHPLSKPKISRTLPKTPSRSFQNGIYPLPRRRSLQNRNAADDSAPPQSLWPCLSGFLIRRAGR